MANNDSFRDLKTLTPRQRARRNAILRTVRKHLISYGYDGLNMRKIARDASVSPSTLYEIYDSKDDLILAAIRETILDLSSLEEQRAAGLDRFVNRLNSLGALITETPKLGDALLALLVQGGEHSAGVEILLKNAFLARRASILEMQEQKQLRRNIDVDLYARNLVAITWGVILLVVKKQLPMDRLAQELVRGSVSVLMSAATARFRPTLQNLVD